MPFQLSVSIPKLSDILCPFALAAAILTVPPTLAIKNVHQFSDPVGSWRQACVSKFLHDNGFIITRNNLIAEERLISARNLNKESISVTFNRDEILDVVVSATLPDQFCWISKRLAGCIAQ